MQFTRREVLVAGSSMTALMAAGCRDLSVTGTQGADDLISAAGDRLLQFQPETATTLGVDTGANLSLRSQLGDRSPAGQARLADMLKADLAAAEAIDTSDLPHATATSLAVIRSAYSTALEGFALPYGDVAVGGWRNTPYVVIQNVGAYLDTPRFLDAEHQIENSADAEAYLSRLAAMADQLDGETERMKLAAEAGLVPPDFLIEKALPQMRSALANMQDPSGSLVTSLTRRTTDIAGDWERRAGDIASGPVAAAMQRQLAEMERQAPLAASDPGMAERPGGSDYYQWVLKASTTTTMTPDEIHQMGLEELAALHAEMDPILQRLGYTSGTVGERMNALAEDDRFKFKPGDEGRQEIMEYIDGWLKNFRELMPQAFNTLVRGNVEVRRLPPEEEPGAPGAYGGAGSIDGTVPGKFWINLYTTDLHSKYSLPDLAAHEAIPGHVWQGEYANKLPLIRTLLAFNAYSEGWALYAEQLVAELGAYDDFEVGKLGYLQSLAFRACRLVVDTGLHAKQWSREQGVAFFVERNGSNPIEVASEVDRYCSWAGQACGYKVGHSEILRQRSRAMDALGSRYDLKAFNDTMVLGGNVPLDVLARNVDDYIARS